MKLITPPQSEPVSVSEAKAAARLSDIDAFDDQIPALIAAARQLAEQITGRLLIEQTWRIELADWPSVADRLPIAGATAVQVSYFGIARAWHALSPAPEFVGDGPGTRIAPAFGEAWPQLGEVAIGHRVRIDITAGAPDASVVGDDIKLYIKSMVCHWIDHPAGVGDAGLQPHPVYARLLDRSKEY